jgi:hypothetical protein
MASSATSSVEAPSPEKKDPIAFLKDPIAFNFICKTQSHFKFLCKGFVQILDSLAILNSHNSHNPPNNISQ